MTTVDIIIVGGGIIGQTLALALVKQAPVSIVILESETSLKWCSTIPHHRVSAISLASKRIFENLEIWESIRKERLSPFHQMEVWDVLGKGEINFNSRDISERALGYIIENNLIHSSLTEKISRNPSIQLFEKIRPITFSENENAVEVSTHDGQLFKAKLAIACDGSHSWLRQQAKLLMNEYDYEQEAIVATVRTALTHQATARQVFLEKGSLAFLPLNDPNLSSIVWSYPKTDVFHLMQMEENQFKKELGKAFAHRLGEIIHLDKRYQFPLVAKEAKQYVKSRVVLAGDAAHTIHPLAGQGINMGLLDAISLAEVLSDAIKNQRDFSARSHLRRYERFRKADNFMMQKVIHMLSQLFTQKHKMIQQLRSFGLHTTEKNKWIKNILMRYAVGDRSELPDLAKKSK